MQIMDFVTVMILAFAIILALAGIFTAYFGTGKSRTAGIIMLIVGVAVGVLWVFLCNGFGSTPIIDNVDIGEVLCSALIDLVGFMIGAIAAIAIFLVAVLKS